MFDQFLALIPELLKSKSGAVFNSGRSAFSSPSKLYILGLNPGGAPDKHLEETVQSHTNMVLSRPDNWSGYKDESWDGRKAGTAGLQPRVLHLLNKLDLDPHLVPSSNIVFQRTSNEADVAKCFEKLAAQCWPFHQHIIEQLGIRVVLCFGKRAGYYVRKKINANHFVGEFAETNNRKWKSQAFVNPSGITVVAATHPSRVDWSNPNSDPTPLLRHVLQK